jgi:tetratricopeptide (TPR) repeat protein
VAGVQRVRGNQNVQIQDVENSWIQVTYDSVSRVLPLESAEIPVSSEHPPPARLVNARAGIFNFVGRAELRAELDEWIDSADPFAIYLIAGRGGSGKTRLAVELCLQLRESGWVGGFLVRGDGEGRLDALIETPCARLVVIDYAENRVEQLERLLPQLSASADAENPVRVLLLVRTGTGEAEDVPGRLKTNVQSLKRVIEGCHVRVLEESRERLSSDERAELFADASVAFARYAKSPSPASPPPDLDHEVFENPLMVVIAAYLAAHGEKAPESRGDLLDGVLEHERAYWQASATGLDADEPLLERAVAMATLLRAESETEGAEHLLLHPDLREETVERRNRLARWVRAQYPGPRWWNPLEPDLLGEHLVACCFADQPTVLQGALATEAPEDLTRPLEVLGRAAIDHPDLAAALGPILSEALPRLVEIAVTQAQTTKDRDLLYGNVISVAAAIEAILAVVSVDGSAVVLAADLMPPRSDLLLNNLAYALTARKVEFWRLATEEDPVHANRLAGALSDLSNRLSAVGRRTEAMTAIEKAVAIARPLAKEDPDAHGPSLAIALNNLSLRLGDHGRRAEALPPTEDAIAIYRSLAKERPEFRAHFGSSLINLSNRLAELGRRPEALVAAEEAVEKYRELVEENPGKFEPDLATSLNNLSIRFSDLARPSDALAPMEESAKIGRRLAEENPAAYAESLVPALSNLAIRLSAVGRQDEALTISEEAVDACRSLVKVDPVAYAPRFASSLHTLTIRLVEAGRRDEALTTAEESVAAYRSLIAAGAAFFVPRLANSLNNFSLELATAGRGPEALDAAEEAVAIYRDLEEESPGVYLLDFAGVLGGFSNRLDEAGCQPEALAAIEEAVEFLKSLAAADADSAAPSLAAALHALSGHRLKSGLGPGALEAIEESVSLYVVMAEASPGAFARSLAITLHSVADRLAEAGRDQDALEAAEKSVGFWRVVLPQDPAAHGIGLATSLRCWAGLLRQADRQSEADVAEAEATDLEAAAEETPWPEENTSEEP